VWVALLAASGLFFYVLGFVLPWSGPGGWFAILVPPMGALAVARVYLIRAKTLKGDDLDQLRKGYEKRFFLGYAIINFPALAAFIGAFVQNALWVYALGIPFFLVGMIMIAPTRRQMAIDNERLRAAGSRFRVEDALAKGSNQA